MPLNRPSDAESDGGRAQAPASPSKPNRHANKRQPTRGSPSSSSSSSSSSVSPVARRHGRLHVGVFSKRKGVKYNSDGRVLACRFCEILRVRDEPFLYEDDMLAVFRPLHPIVPSHILIVPRAHIRNVNQLTVDHVELLRRMRAVAEHVIRTLPCLKDGPQSTSSGEEDEMRAQKNRMQDSPKDVSVDEFPGHTMADEDDDEHDHELASPSYQQHGDENCRYAFHVPPFNSIDHVHMHAFRGSTGYLGRIKYRTESWWCRSYDEVLARLDGSSPSTHTQSSSHQTHRRTTVLTTQQR